MICQGDLRDEYLIYFAAGFIPRHFNENQISIEEALRQSNELAKILKKSYLKVNPKTKNHGTKSSPLRPDCNYCKIPYAFKAIVKSESDIRRNYAEC